MKKDAVRHEPPRPWRWAGLGLALLLAIGLLPGAMSAQEGATIMGRVVTEAGQPVSSAQVVIVGTNRGTLTDARGVFQITNVPAGAREVRVISLGYRPVSQTVQVVAGQSMQLEFTLAVSALALDEVVVTGQATGTARRAIGGSVATVDVGALDESAVQNFSQLLQARAPGVNVLAGGGKSGQGSRVVLRGAASISQRNEPLIYVDGVRIDNTSRTGLTTTAITATAGVSWAGLDDINPADIERIEIIRGASAATLYGTEAAAGVIQIFTRRGRQGPPTWNLSSEFGVANTPRSWWQVSEYSDWFYDNMVQTGTQHTQQLSVSGGGDRFVYYAAGTVRGEDGILPNSGEDYGALRLNLSVFPLETVTLRLNSAFSRRAVQHVPDANNTRGYTINGLVGGPRGQFGTPTTELTVIEAFQRGNRFTGGLTMEHQPWQPFSHRVTFGADVFNSDEYQFFPFGAVVDVARGYRTNYRRQNINLNVDYAGTLRTDLTPTISSTTSSGFQYFDRDEGWSQAVGDGFPYFGLETVSAALTTSAGEGRIAERTAGFFLEQQFGFANTFFITAGARADAHSAFGEEVGYQIYPKVDASYVVSEHGFWPQQLGSLRVRGAYGTAGAQPGFFDAVRTWIPEAAQGGQPAVRPGNLGNPNLRPEVSHEMELGLDAGILADRVNVELTFYDQRTRDALYQVRYPPSQGFLSTQLENVGEVHNRGLELGIRGAVVELPGFRWDATVNMSRNRNELVSLGGGAPIQLQWLQFHREGYPVGSFFGDRVVEVDGQVGQASVLLRGADGTLPEGWDFIGSPLPTQTAQLGSRFSLANGTALNILFDHRGGHYLQSSTMRWLMDPRRAIVDNPEIHQGAGRPGPVALVCRPENNPDQVTVRVCNTNSTLTQADFAYKADFWKLRELGVSYQVPEAFATRVGAGAATLTLSGRNLWRTQSYPGLEAEAMYRNDLSDSALRNQIFFDTPIPRQVVAGVNVQF